MKKLELYDIITLDDNTEYTILKMLNENNNRYALLAPIDEEEEPDMENVRIIRLLESKNEMAIEEVEETKAQDLAKKFLNLLREGITEIPD